MSNRRRGLKFWLNAWLPVVVCVGVIALESTPQFGSDHTSAPLRWLYQALFGPISDYRWDIVHHFIRKSGHFLGYGLVGLAWLRAWWMTLPRFQFVQDALLALIATAAVAGADEFHQTFLPNRTGRPQDVLLDCCGAITVLLVVYLFMRLRKPDRPTKAA